MRITSLSPALGAEITGIDVSGALSDADFSAVTQALHDHDGVLVLRDQNLSPDQHIEFSRRFGELFGETEPYQDTVTKYLLPGYPQIFRASNKIVEGEPQGRTRAGNYWHSDVSFRPRPAMVSILYAIEIPSIGGDTLFCNMYSAYERLSDPVQQFLSSLTSRHDFARNTNIGFSHENISEQDLEGGNAAEHPVVRTHPESGRRCLFVNPGNTSRILELHLRESDELLEFLFNHSVQEESIYRHRWSVNDLMIWDNRCVMHYAIADYDEDRYMHRTTVMGEKPV